jgi:ABC-type transporter Mla subunit MlaD
LALGLAALGLFIYFVFFNEEGNAYEVRAIFDNAANTTQGEQVKVAGVPVGSIEAIEPTPETPAKAAVVMKITKPGFENFRVDASCTIKPQSLLGEKYVDCQPTQPRIAGTPEPAALKVIPQGHEGAGQRLLPVENTSSPVDPDLVQDIQQLPERERLRIILNELGTGLEGRGPDLHAVILRANPALRETNKVLQILANENRTLSKLAIDSDQALAPLAAVRKQFADSFVQQGKVATASANQEAALSRNLQLFPAFLEQLGPAMERLGHFGQATAATMRELGLAAPGLNRLFAALPSFSEKSIPYFQSLGRFGQTAGPDFKAIEPLLDRLITLGNAAQPFSTSFSSLLSSLRDTGGLERFMDFIFLTAGATNGYNALGHFLRADAISLALCTVYRAEPSGCNANLQGGTASSAAQAAVASSASPTELLIKRTQAELGGASAAQAIERYPGSPPNSGGNSSTARPRHGQRGGAASVSATPAAGTQGASRLLLNYLLGE